MDEKLRFGLIGCGGQGRYLSEALSLTKQADFAACADLDLERAIVGLPERARQVLVLFHLAGLGHAETGQAMGIDPGTSKAQLHRARKLMREWLS